MTEYIMQIEVGNAPITVQKVVRCRECKHLDTHNHRCKVWNHGVYAWFDFCSRAERREDEPYDETGNSLP